MFILDIIKWNRFPFCTRLAGCVWKNTQAATNINLIFTLQLKIFIEVN